MWILLAAALFATPGAPTESLHPLATQDAERVLLHEPTRVTEPGEARAAALRAHKEWALQLYAGLFEELHLDAGKADDLATLIAEHELLTTSESGGSMSVAPSSPTDRDRASADEYLSKIKSALGTRGYEVFESYRATLPERVYLRRLAQRLTLAGVPFTPEEANILVEVLRSERERMQAIPIGAPTKTLEHAEATIRKLDEFDVLMQQRFTALLSREQNEIAARFFQDRKRERHVALDQHRQYVAEGGSPDGFSYPVH